MKDHEDYSAFPFVYSENEFAIQGLTKLEYAAIHIAAGVAASEPGLYSDHVARMSIAIAKQIFKQIENDNTPTLPDSEF